MKTGDLHGLRYREGDGGHVESWFAKLTEPEGQRAFWTRFTIFARPPLPPVAEAWAIAFDRARGHFAVKSTVALAAARFAPDALAVEIDGCSLDLERARGSLASGRGAVDWELHASPARAAPIIHLPSPALYRDASPLASKLVTPLSDAVARGSIRVDRGQGDIDTWDVRDWPMMIGHNWGRGHAHAYAWSHGNTWDVDGLVFEGVTAQVRMGPVLTPPLTSAFVRWRGRSWDLSRLRTLAKRRGRMSLRRWEMTAEDAGLRVTYDVAAETDDVVGLHYPNPDGSMTYCLNTMLARARIELRLPDGESVTASSRAVALEIGTSQRDHGARMYL